MAKIVKKEFLGPKKVYDITVEDTHNFYAASKDGAQNTMVLAHNCHRLSTQAMDALLKPMEDNIPGTKDKRLVVLFCTTEPEKLRGTIKSRCLVFNIKEPTREAMIQRLRFIADAENIAIDDESLDVIFSYGKGHIRDMVNGLERVSRVLPKKDEGVLPETGAIVRQQLGLGVVEKEYQILLNLKDDIDASMLSLSDALTQADANNVYSGIADAALAAFRHQKGITIGLGYIEKSLCAELGKVYSEEELLNIAHHIMNTSRKVDRNALVCELLVLQDKIRKGILGHTSGVVTVERIVERSVESMSSTSPPNKSVPQPRGSVPKVKTKLGDYAQIDMAHGASAARGVPVKPSNIVEDPAVTHVKSKVPVHSPPAVGSLVPIINRKPMVPDDD